MKPSTKWQHTETLSNIPTPFLSSNNGWHRVKMNPNNYSNTTDSPTVQTYQIRYDGIKPPHKKWEPTHIAQQSTSDQRNMKSFAQGSPLMVTASNTTTTLRHTLSPRKPSKPTVIVYFQQPTPDIAPVI